MDVRCSVKLHVDLLDLEIYRTCSWQGGGGVSKKNGVRLSSRQVGGVYNGLPPETITLTTHP